MQVWQVSVFVQIQVLQEKFRLDHLIQIISLGYSEKLTLANDDMIREFSVPTSNSILHWESSSCKFKC